MEPYSCDTFVALPPATVGNRVIFGKNSDRLFDEVQEVIYFPAAVHSDLSKRLKCTYIEIDQVPETYAVVLSRPAWLWGAEMGANEHGVCIGNEAVWGREAISKEEALLGMDLVRLGLERADTAEKALDVIVDLLEKYGQGGNCAEGEEFSYYNSFLIADRNEAWILETSGKYWAAEKVQGIRNISNQLSITSRIDREHPDMRNYAKQKGWWDGQEDFDFAAAYSYINTASMMTSPSRYCQGYTLLNKHKGNITFETMMGILRDEPSGINMKGEFLSTASMVSVLPRDSSLPCVHFFTGTPHPERSVFKPFIFVPHISQLFGTQSPTFELERPLARKPYVKPDRRHPLYQKHQQALEVISHNKEKSKTMLDNMRKLEKEVFEEMESVLQSKHLDVDKTVNLFSQCVKDEIKIYQSNISS
ncbi:Secernin-3 [Microtus ochrogaster]|uniref:Secernin-3 n=1 Tax=Microtus ochrogaster TaxID=79684 RepID=A0A8J6FU11_MICOH|nr:Secernin-3 [Microtus ochrogaster]